MGSKARAQALPEKVFETMVEDAVVACKLTFERTIGREMSPESAEGLVTHIAQVMEYALDDAGIPVTDK